MEEPLAIEAPSVDRAGEQITDGRAKQGVRSSIAFVVTVMRVGKLAGMTTPEAIAEWVPLRAAWLKQVVPMPRETFPCASTDRTV